MRLPGAGSHTHSVGVERPFSPSKDASASAHRKFGHRLRPNPGLDVAQAMRMGSDIGNLANEGP